MARRQMLEVHEDIGSLLRIIADPKQAQARFEQYKSYLEQMTAAAQRVEETERGLAGQSEEIMRRDQAVRAGEKALAAERAKFAEERDRQAKQIKDRIATLEKREKEVEAHIRAAKEREREAAKRLQAFEQREADLRVDLAQAAEARVAAEQARNEVEARLAQIRALGQAVAA